MIRILLSARLGERRWTQARLAQETGLRPATINELYNEMVDSISLEKLDKICHALNCDVGDILVVETDQLRRTLADKPLKEKKTKSDDSFSPDLRVILFFSLSPLSVHPS